MTSTVHAVVSGDRAEEAPLTWSQRGMWDAIGRNAPGHFNIGRKLPVVGDTSVTDAVDALGELLARHESLRTRIKLAGGEPVQAVERSGRLPVRVVEASGDAAAAATALLGELLAGGFDHPRELPVRAGLVTADGRVRWVTLAFCHTAVDWPATEVVLRDLRLLLEGADLPPAGPQPLDLARRQRDADANVSRRAIEYWSAAFRRIPPAMLEPTGPPHHPPHQEAAFNSRAAHAAVRVVAARHGLGTSTVLLAATAALLGTWAGHDTSALNVIAGNRFRPDLKDMVGMLSQLGVFVLDVDAPVTFDDLLKRASAASLRAYWHAHYDQAALDQATAAVSQERGTQVNPYACFNDLRSGGDDAAALARSAPQVDEAAVRAAMADTTFTYLGQVEQIRCRFCLGVRDTPDEAFDNARVFGSGGHTGALRRVLRVSLRADTRCLPPDHIEGFLRDLEHLLVESAFGEVRLPLRAPAREGSAP